MSRKGNGLDNAVADDGINPKSKPSLKYRTFLASRFGADFINSILEG
ncbi:hypothetical protein [Algoriphagus boritolerans]|uniref:Uncharacterized protein n=1 Tax=Algoriphagus boritolerans DSM 17298 = JCM 18970 TaxID=1120964 RepID=A0A1H5SPJ0_9BACT|nr:hypothetical protein [Algoriphagus boritolerans]SEF52489.1 hypothetical protein SAMN03080598_00443 [Algoriphagus boritolerans DSM 17298 = JCM 18970]